MNRTERLYRIDQLLHQRGLVSRAELLCDLEISWATLKRDLAYLRDRLNAPIVFDSDRGGYRFDQNPLGPQYELPGLWFNAQEILALLTMHRLLDELDSGGLLGPQVGPLMARLKGLLENAPGDAEQVMQRVKIVTAHNRPVTPAWFEIVGIALMQRKRLQIQYFTRTRNESNRREISPQRIVHYRNAWYLDAWCHRSDALRIFALDAIQEAHLLGSIADEVPTDELDREVAAGYGIFRGQQLQWAVLHFSADAARWVSAEVWHPQQQGKTLEDGSFELRVPYSASPELEMDILRHAEHVRVIAPDALRDQIARRLRNAAQSYR
jgi:predicted DNA-binding transcriptional regulator YafY